MNNLYERKELNEMDASELIRRIKFLEQKIEYTEKEFYEEEVTIKQRINNMLKLITQFIALTGFIVTCVSSMVNAPIAIIWFGLLVYGTWVEQHKAKRDLNGYLGDINCWRKERGFHTKEHWYYNESGMIRY